MNISVLKNLEINLKKFSIIMGVYRIVRCMSDDPIYTYDDDDAEFLKVYV